MLSALSSGLSGMLAHQRALDVSAHNTANASTEGFEPARASFSELPNGGAQAGTSPSTRVTLSASVSAAAAYMGSGTDLASEAVNSLTYRLGFEASAKMVKTADQMLGALIDTKA